MIWPATLVVLSLIASATILTLRGHDEFVADVLQSVAMVLTLLLVAASCGAFN